MTAGRQGAASERNGATARSKASKRRFDIGTRLFLSFCAIAALTVMAAAVAWVLFGEVRKNLDLIAEESVSEIVNSFRLAQESAHLSTALPAVARAADVEDLEADFRRVSARLEAIKVLAEVHEAHEEESGGSGETLSDLAEAVDGKLAQLKEAVEARLVAREERVVLSAALNQDHSAFLAAIDPAVEVARNAMIESTRRSVTEGTAGISSLIDENFDALRSVLVVQADIYLLVLAINQAAASSQLDEVHDLRFAIVEPIAEIKGALSQVADSPVTHQLRSIASAIIKTAIGDNNIFVLKKAILQRGEADTPLQQRELAQHLETLELLQKAFDRAGDRATLEVDTAIIEAATQMSQEGQAMVVRARSGIDRLEGIVLLRSEVNRLFGLLSQASTALTEFDVGFLSQRYLGLNFSVTDLMAKFADGEATAPIEEAVTDLLAYGTAGKSILEVRGRELAAAAEADRLFEESQALDAALSERTQVLVTLAEEKVEGASGGTLAALARGEVVLLIITIISLAAVVLIAWVIVLRGIVRRLASLSSSMLALADGQLDAPISAAEWNDEITDMGEALEVFRADAIRRREAERSLREAKERAETALADLKAAQRRLVQAEKMASLGQLTAGIAHEIKNPLNFVNNFASLSRELLEELRELLAGVRDQLSEEAREEVADIFADLDMNLDKINEHGQRADGIVRGMLDHSRESDSSLVASDLNKLLEEYVNLAYHGMRAQTKDFNVTIERDLESGLGEVEVVAQDIGRVFLNIVANAFQAIYQKARDAGPDFDPKLWDPKLWIATKSAGERVELRIRDNGPGIPNSVLEKIFQPFFTTKPSGEGTGLGLSISYDIVVQQHGGLLEATSEPGEGTEFLISLPRKATEAVEPALQKGP